MGVEATTVTLPFFTELFKIWYKQEGGKIMAPTFSGGKVLPNNIAELLTPIAIGYWLSGDGSYSKTTGRITIHTESFTAAEVDQLRSALLAKYNIESTLIFLIKLRNNSLYG